MANKTKYKLAGALSELLNTTPLDKITVGEISKRAQVSRQTFYYHFRDTHELLEWTFRRALQQIRDIPESDQQKRLLAAIDYLRENRVFVLNVYRSLGMEQFARGLECAIRPLLAEAAKQPESTAAISERSREFTLSFFSYGVTGSILQWLDDGMPEDLNDIINDIYGVMKGNLPQGVLPE